MINVTRNELIVQIQLMVVNHVKMDNSYKDDARHLIAVSDEFWPVDSDSMIDDALDNEDSDELQDAVANVAGEVYSKVVDFYCNAWNHGPGYVRPKGLVWDEESMSAIEDGAVAIWERVTV